MVARVISKLLDNPTSTVKLSNGLSLSWNQKNDLSTTVEQIVDGGTYHAVGTDNDIMWRGDEPLSIKTFESTAEGRQATSRFREAAGEWRQTHDDFTGFRDSLPDDVRAEAVDPWGNAILARKTKLTDRSPGYKLAFDKARKTSSSKRAGKLELPVDEFENELRKYGAEGQLPEMLEYIKSGVKTTKTFIKNFNKRHASLMSVDPKRLSLTKDHILPVNKGGMEVPENLNPMVGARNFSKQDKGIPPMEFFTMLGITNDPAEYVKWWLNPSLNRARHLTTAQKNKILDLAVDDPDGALKLFEQYLSKVKTPTYDIRTRHKITPTAPAVTAAGEKEALQALGPRNVKRAEEVIRETRGTPKQRIPSKKLGSFGHGDPNHPDIKRLLELDRQLGDKFEGV